MKILIIVLKNLRYWKNRRNIGGFPVLIIINANHLYLCDSFENLHYILKIHKKIYEKTYDFS